MNNLKIINQNGQLVTDSRDVAEMIGKSHTHLMRDIQGYVKVLYPNPKLDSANFFIISTYKDVNNQERPCYLLTKKGCDMVANKMTGEKGVLFTATYVTEFENMEKKLKNPVSIEQFLTSPDTIIKIAQNWKEEKQKRLAVEQQIKQQKPKVIFADSVTASKTSILVGELAKIIKQNGHDIGQNTLFVWLRSNGYLISRKGTDYNMPTQKAMELNLFEIKETSITHSDGHISISKTSKVTGKGQVYFVNKFREAC